MLTGGSVPSSPEPSYAPMPEEDAFWNEAPSAPPIKQVRMPFLKCFKVTNCNSIEAI